VETVVEYSKALAALDRGDKTTAKKSLTKVVKDQPDFKLAALDLDKMMQ
jgi:Tfp pilus assembly protein PilF